MSDNEQDCTPSVVLDTISCLLADIDEYVENLAQRFRATVFAKLRDSVDDLLELVDLLADADHVSQSSLVDDECSVQSDDSPDEDGPPTPSQRPSSPNL